MNETLEVQEAPIQQDQPEPAGAFQIETIDQFGHLVAEWHSNTMNTLTHMLEVPTGMEVVIEGEEPFKLEGEIQKGYKLGLNVAMSYIRMLPFVSTDAPDESQPH
jgi:hypothetical protein